MKRIINVSKKTIIVGGCCGFNPNKINMLRQIIKKIDI